MRGDTRVWWSLDLLQWLGSLVFDEIRRGWMQWSCVIVELDQGTRRLLLQGFEVKVCLALPCHEASRTDQHACALPPRASSTRCRDASFTEQACSP